MTEANAQAKIAKIKTLLDALETDLREICNILRGSRT